ncbi:MAG: NAD(P)/FAD-dependent oxidoreductase [Pseudomonadales bacterium]|nr:NAD(P)/FAD-dependent oxidoreductase [Pseudomonadales bacterium]
MTPRPDHSHLRGHKTNVAKIAILGGGVAGSTIALRLAELGIHCTLIEKSDSLVNGPPICHLHAGGNLYREISDQQCLNLLTQSIETVKVYPQSINQRPTVIALPKEDKGRPEDLIPRLTTLQNHYATLIQADNTNKVLGEPEDYFQLFDKKTLLELAEKPLPETPKTAADWMIPVAKQLDFSKLKFPLILVQEYGISGFRLAAIVTLALPQLPSCTVLKHTQVTHIAQRKQGLRWQLEMTNSENGTKYIEYFDYLINACGFKSGEIDDMLNHSRQRMVEFKAAYVAHWPQCEGQWPEVIFYGERGTPQGMAQLTPYPNGFFQLHGMTQDITLFKDGLVASSPQSAQPQLDARFIKKMECSWPSHSIQQRTLGSIEHMAQFIPAFKEAEVAAKPLFGAQQIPGSDPALRTAEVSFVGEYYARTEIVKVSSAVAAADQILQHLFNAGLLPDELSETHIKPHHFPVTTQLQTQEVEEKAQQIALQRHYPSALAKTF